MVVVVDTFGSFIGKKSERLVVKQKDGSKKEQPFFDISQVIIATNGVSISSDAIQACLERGVQIVFASRQGQPYGLLSGPEMGGTIKTRRAQLMAYHDQRGLQFALASATGKMQNQANNIKYFLKSRKDNELLMKQTLVYLRAIEQAIKQTDNIHGNCIDAVRDRIMAAEGQAVRNYWQAMAQMLPQELNFAKREHRGSGNEVNMLLNYGYGILYARAWQAIVLAGLDPYGGFLHVDRPGKPSLVLDFVEEFRQPVVDRVVFAALLKGQRATLEDEFLSLTTRRDLAKRINERLNSTDNYHRKKVRLEHIMLQQARRLATFLRDEAAYKAHVASW